MSTRTTNETITFKHPFKMSELDEVQPAGRKPMPADAYLRGHALPSLAG